MCSGTFPEKNRQQWISVLFLYDTRLSRHLLVELVPIFFKGHGRRISLVLLL